MPFPLHPFVFFFSFLSFLIPPLPLPSHRPHSGFQLGELNVLIDKRLPYEYDLRIHQLFRGPGIKPGMTFDYIGTNVDIAPTLLGLAGIDTPPTMDGKSVVPLIVDPSDPAVPEATRSHILRSTRDGGLQAYRDNWRDSFFYEYYYVDFNAKVEENAKGRGVGVGVEVGRRRRQWMLAAGASHSSDFSDTHPLTQPVPPRVPQYGRSVKQLHWHPPLHGRVCASQLHRVSDQPDQRHCL